MGSQEFKELQLEGNISESIIEYTKTKFRDEKLIAHAKIIYLSFILGIGFLTAGLSLLLVYIDSCQRSEVITDREIIAFMISLLFAVFIFFNYKIKIKAD